MLGKFLPVFMLAAAATLPFAVQARLERSTPVDDQVVRSDKLPMLVKTAEGYGVQRARDGMFYVTAHINGRPLRFLVDTGASMVVLSSHDARAVGVVSGSIDYANHVRAVAGNAPVAYRSIAKFELAGRRIEGLEAAIVKDGVGVSLLGHNALNHFEKISIKGNQLTLH